MMDEATKLLRELVDCADADRGAWSKPGYRWYDAIEAARAYLEALPAAAPRELTFALFREANVRRCLKWHPAGIESWSPSDWLTAVTGELGELASLLKMRNRERDGLPGNKFSPSGKQVADEIADVLTYLDLLAAALGVDLGAAAVEKFNEVSARVGFPDRIEAPAAAQPAPLPGPPREPDMELGRALYGIHEDAPGNYIIVGWPTDQGDCVIAPNPAGVQGQNTMQAGGDSDNKA